MSTPMQATSSGASGAASAGKRLGASNLARPLPYGKTIGISSFAFLFAEMVAYYRGRVSALSDLEAKLDAAGYGIGLRFLELTAFRERPGRREAGVVPMLQFASSAVWTALFGRPADALEKSTDKAHAYMIRDDEPLVNSFISVPKDMSRFNPAAFMAGILRGVLDGAGYPCTVQAVTVAAEGGGVRDRTVFLVTFEEGVAGTG